MRAHVNPSQTTKEATRFYSAFAVRHMLSQCINGSLVHAKPAGSHRQEDSSQSCPRNPSLRLHQIITPQQDLRRQVLGKSLVAVAGLLLGVATPAAAKEGSSGSTSGIRFTPNAKEADQRSEARKAEMKAKLKAKIEKAQGTK